MRMKTTHETIYIMSVTLVFIFGWGGFIWLVATFVPYIWLRLVIVFSVIAIMLYLMYRAVMDEKFGK